MRKTKGGRRARDREGEGRKGRGIQGWNVKKEGIEHGREGIRGSTR